ncbi:MAG: Root adhesin [Bacteroidota bacterium]
MRYFITTVLFVLVGFSLWAQVPCNSIRDAKAQRLVDQASNYLRQFPARAQKQLEDALMIEGTSTEAHFLLGEILLLDYYAKSKFKDNAAEADVLFKETEGHFKKSIKFCATFNGSIAHYYLAKLYYERRKRTECAMYLNHFLANGTNLELRPEAEWLKAELDSFAYLKSHPVAFVPKPIAALNSYDDEYLPMLSPDGSMMFFTRRSKTKVRKGDKFLDEYFMVSEFQNGDFGAPTDLPTPFNDGKNTGGATISADNNTMFVTICNNTMVDGTAYKNCDIFESHRQKSKWTTPQELGDEINGRLSFEAQPTLSPDGKTLYFVSIREGGLGGMDIYRSRRLPNGKWQRAENLGSEINTALNDKTPFIHPDGKTFYFSSDGRHGMGNFDIYFTRIKDKGWESVRNIGYPINTEDDDLGLMVSLDGETLCFSSSKLSGNAQLDLFSAVTPAYARPDKVLFVKGHVDAPGGGLGQGLEVGLENLQTGVRTEGLVDQTNGNYAVSVNNRPENEQMLVVEKPGNMFKTVFLDPAKQKKVSPIKLDIDMPKLEKGVVLELENIYFEFNSSKFDYKSKVTLAHFLKFLTLHSKYNCRIMGHTDAIGNDTYNLQLSTERSKAVFDFLIANRIDAKRLDFKGFGSTKPKADNATDAGRAKNRRTEFELF